MYDFDDFDKLFKSLHFNEGEIKMRDRERIERILNLIATLWKRSPDMRLGQLLYNFGGFKDADYNTEDDETEKNLEESVRKYIKYTG